MTLSDFYPAVVCNVDILAEEFLIDIRRDVGGVPDRIEENRTFHEPYDEPVLTVVRVDADIMVAVFWFIDDISVPLCFEEFYPVSCVMKTFAISHFFGMCLVSGHDRFGWPSVAATKNLQHVCTVACRITDAKVGWIHGLTIVFLIVCGGYFFQEPWVYID